MECMTGVEPAHREIHASETCVSTNSTTWPNDTLIYPATGIAVVPLVSSLLDAEVRNRLDGLLFSPLSVDSQSK